MIEVHHLNDSRSQRILWLLEELSLEYRIVSYERDPKTRLAPASAKAIHPLGKFPIVIDGNTVLAESGAIIEYLVERHGRDRLVPATDSEAHVGYRYWLHYAEGSLMPQILINLYLGRVGEAAGEVQQRVQTAIGQHLNFVESSLQTDFLAGPYFTAADIQMSFPIEVAATQRFLNDTQPRLRAWLSRLHSRPAYQRALEAGGPYAYGNT